MVFAVLVGHHFFSLFLKLNAFNIELEIKRDHCPSTRHCLGCTKLCNVLLIMYLLLVATSKNSGVTTAPANAAMYGGGTLGGRQITEFAVF